MGLCAASIYRRVQTPSGTRAQLNTSVPTKLAAGRNATADKLLVAASELMIERASIEVSLSDIGNKDGLLLE